MLGVSSAHVNFVTEADSEALEGAGFMLRSGVQYHWFNRRYASFSDFLDAFSSRKRKQVRRERTEAVSDGIRINHLIGKDITEAHWDAFWDFYQDTGSRKWGRPYLTRAFFRTIAETMPERLLLIVAERQGIPIAGALNFIGGDALYGRYWGAIEKRPFLHFEICYYQAIEFAIERGLARIEAGAQGEHKIARGYEPVLTRSAHWIADPSFRRAVAHYLDGERREINATLAALSEESPYRKDCKA
jgi:predicted N-acyltransferase